MWRTLLKSCLVGILIAVVLLVCIPSLTKKENSIIGNLLDNTSTHPRYSLNYAVRRASPAVVNIYSRRYNTKNKLQLSTEGLGSGVIMNSNGFILTNYHVIAKADQVIVALQDGRISTAQLIGSDSITDLAVLKISIENLPVIPQDINYKTEIGDIVLAIGNPYNLGQTTTLGIISATGRSGMSFGRQDFLQTDAAINAGNSGGALVNSQGILVGINTASFQDATDLETYGISFAIPYKLANKIMAKLIADGRVIRGYVGIDGVDINPMVSQLLGDPEIRGVQVNHVTPGSPAAIAGIRPEDLIIKINKIPLTGARDAMDKATELRPGTQATFTILRHGEEKDISLTIGESR